MQLHGSCHCQRVVFSVQAPHPYPYNLCYCSICRKTAGGGGHAINLGARAESLTIEGREHLSVYRAKVANPETGEMTESKCRRHFCKHCGSALWVWDSRWPKLIHPFASAIDTELPMPPEHNHMMLGSKAGWVPIHAAPQDKQYEQYPDESLADWHRQRGLEQMEENMNGG